MEKFHYTLSFVMDLANFFSLANFSHQVLFEKKGPLWAPLKNLKNYLNAFHEFRIESEIPQGVYLKNREQIAIGTNVVIEPGVMISGPCIIGKGSCIRHGAYLREFVILGDGCQVGHAAEVKHSILLSGASASHFTYVGDSILGSWVNLGAGVKCANLRLSREEITIWLHGEKVSTGLKKMGAIVGDLTQVGCNSVLNPGTLIERGCLIPPLTSLKGIVFKEKNGNPRLQTTR